MSDLKGFLKTNKKQRENVQYPASKYLTDNNGDVLLWTIRPISSKENDKLRDSCTTTKFENKKKITDFDSSKYMNKLLVASIQYPDLNNKELQDSYGVMCAEDLIQEMIDEPGEYANLIEFITKFNGFDETIDKKVEEAKN